ncbi:NADP-dependent oxidoreductase [Nonomuraea sp. NPDC000554]|uniref:NADP-dependent oxidoreductase n=1 Tax=Nonomuraea sp. NPDC000554 TaxID=3154259 RepID=UPI00331DBBF6
MSMTMRAVVAEDYGPPENLTVQRIPVPVPGRGQIQVRVRAAALNPADLRLLTGTMREQAPLTFPYVLGSDFAGTVTEVGDGVSRFAVGDEVFGLGLPRAASAMAAIVSDPPSLTTGTMAEYAVFDADTPAIARRPADLAAEHAASLPMVALTALPLLRASRFQPADPVLVIGATGGVGSATVPLLAAAKAYVIATATEADQPYVRNLGAADVIDHHTHDVAAETLRRHSDGVAAVINLALPGERLVEFGRLVRPGGQVLNVAFPKPDPAAFGRDDLTVETVYASARPGDVADVAARAVDGSLPAAIGRRYRLDDAARAYRELIAEHTRGKLVVVMDDQP